VVKVQHWADAYISYEDEYEKNPWGSNEKIDKLVSKVIGLYMNEGYFG
jgi:hypothetical protein